MDNYFCEHIADEGTERERMCPGVVVVYMATVEADGRSDEHYYCDTHARSYAVGLGIAGGRVVKTVALR